MKPLGILWLCLSTFSLVGQGGIDLLTFSYRHGPATATSVVPEEATENVAMLNLKIPFVFSEKTIWYSDLTYQSSHVRYTADLPGTINPTKLHGIILQTGLVQRINSANAFQPLLVPRLMTDGQSVKGGHFQLGGIALYERKYSENLTMRYGLMFNREFFGPMWVPLMYLDWQMNERWWINGLLPIFAKVNYRVADRWIAGLSHFGLITSYQIGSPGSAPAYIERKSIDLALFARYRAWGNLHVEARGGYALGRSYSQFAKGDEMDFRVAIATFGDDRVQQNASFDPGPILDFRLVYRLDVD